MCKFHFLSSLKISAGIKSCIEVVALVFLLSYSAFASDFPFYGVITSSGVNLRAGSSINYESLDKLKKGTKVKVVTLRYNWYKIILPKTTACFISRRFLKRANAKKGIVTGNRINLRARPSENASIIGKINTGYVVTVIKTHPEWYEIADAGDAAFGWVHKKFVERCRPEPQVPAVHRKTQEKSIIKTEPKKINKPMPAANGKILPMGIFFRRRGSHKLIVDGKLEYYLKGDLKLLNRFIGYDVNIFGKVIDKENKKIPLIEVEGVEIKHPKN